MLPVTLYFPAGIQTTPPPASSAAWMAFWIAFVASFTPVLSALKGGSVTTQLATTISLDGKTGAITRGIPTAPGIGVLVGGIGVFVFVGVTTGPPCASEISSNQMSPVGAPSVIRRNVTLVFEPLFQDPLRNCQLAAAPAHSWLSPVMSFMSMHAPPTVFVRQ